MMKRFFLCFTLIFAHIALHASSEFPQTTLAQDAWTDSGTFVNGGISLEWEGINSQETDSRCLLSMNLNGDGGNFIRFAFQGRHRFVRIFFTEKKTLFSHGRESLKIAPLERIFFERKREGDDEDDDLETRPIQTVKITHSGVGKIVPSEFFNDTFKFDFGEFSAYAKNPDMFLQMFEKFPLLYSATGSEFIAFFMPKSRELAIAAGLRKGEKGFTIYFSPPEQKDFFLWRLRSSKENSSLLNTPAKKICFGWTKTETGVRNSS